MFLNSMEYVQAVKLGSFAMPLPSSGPRSRGSLGVLAAAKTKEAVEVEPSLAEKINSALDKAKGEFDSASERLENGETVGDIVAEKFDYLMESGLGQQISFGLVSGVCAGVFVKKVSIASAMVVGGVFCMIQGLSYAGYISVDYNKVERDFNKALDLNNDGKLDSKDIKMAYNKFDSVMSFNIPSGSSFGAGLLLGLQL
uniref:EF-hand domain-containing protein n=1 Tax=Heterosigma akashiwo TaxID=2829 RepID=A0A7S3XR85_HETAK|mmetsp:Transcript_19111/g.31668  ORF Transcript_19111/g.31668 Transcript_19111/m.31668 type:complete len:199 (+) Transcript_19111:3-599(+)